VKVGTATIFVDLPKQHKFLFAKWQTFLYDDYVQNCFIVCGLALWFIIVSIFAKNFKNDRVLIAFVIGMLVASYHGFYGYMAGKNLYAHGMAVRDILRASNSTQAKQIFTDSLTQAINSKRFQAIIKSHRCDGYPKSIFKNSRTQKLQTKNVMKPVTGCRSVPKFIAYPPNDSKRNQ